MRSADLLVRHLRAAGVSRVFSLSGNQIMPVFDACFEHGMEIVHTRHEAAAVFMAEAHAQLTGEIGVALVTAGGGLTNAVGPLFSIRESETPMLLLSGDSPVSQDGRGAFQEMDQLSITRSLCKSAVRPRNAADLAFETVRSIRLARSGRPGPVHIALAFDVLESEASDIAPPPPAAFARVPRALSEVDARLMVQALGAAERPLILCGPVLNPSRTGDLTTRLSDALDAPVIAMESPRGLKDPSLGDIAAILREADLVVDLGKRVDFTVGFAKAGVFAADARWILVEVDDGEHDRAHRNLDERLKLAISADPADAAVRLLDIARGARQTGPGRARWRTGVEERLRRRNSDAASPAGGDRITSAQLCAAVQRQLQAAQSSIAICDGGEFGQWAQAATRADRRVLNGVSGVIGGGLCYGLAAALAYPKASVFALMGDGSCGFHFPEFETAARCGAAYVVVIGNDLRWNAEHQIQLREYGADRLIGCELSAARYDLAAQAFGAHGEYVMRIEDLDAALERAVASGKPACVNVLIAGEAAPAGPAH